MQNLKDNHNRSVLFYDSIKGIAVIQDGNCYLIVSNARVFKEELHYSYLEYFCHDIEILNHHLKKFKIKFNFESIAI